MRKNKNGNAIDAVITTQPVKDAVKPEDKIPTGEKICYGLGAFMDGGGVALMSCIMLKYMTDALGIAAAIASTIMMLSKIWDAITDPLMGLISDNTRGRWGRRKPYMFVGGILLVIALALLFAPINEMGITGSGTVAWILIFYIVWNTCSTITQVPYTSMASDISPSYKERNNANTVKLVFSALASGIAYVVPLVLLALYTTSDQYAFLPRIENGYVFWVLMVVIFGTLFGGGLILCGLIAKERVKAPAEKEKITFKKFLTSYVTPFKNKSYRWHIIMYVSAFTCMDILSALAAYYATDVWAGVPFTIGSFSMTFNSMLIVAPLMVAAVLAFPLARVVMDKKNKQFAFRMGLPFYIIGGILLAVMDPAWAPPIVVPIIAFLMGLGFGGAQMMPWIIFPDTLDVAEMKTGERPTGNYSGMMTLFRKVSGAIGVGMIGWVLTAANYKESIADEAVVQPQSALIAIRLFMGIAIALLILIAFLASFRYKVTNKKLDRARYFIDRKAESGYAGLTAEEKIEYNQLCDELYGKDKNSIGDYDSIVGRVIEIDGQPVEEIVGKEEVK